MNATAIIKMKEKREKMRATAFPALDEVRVWDVKNKKRTKGYTSIPRTMPLIGQIMDGLAGKGKPVSSTFLELWCRSDEQGFLTLSKPGETAFASGYSGERGISTWKERVRKLEELGFIATAAGVSSDLNYVQIWNPYLVIKDHADKGTEGFSTRHYHALAERVLEIGAIDLD
jgi:hypothetical protein